MVEFVDINGAQLAYHISGSSNAPLLITLHGGRGQGDHRSDFKIYGQLSDKLRVLSFAYHGHEQSSHTTPYTFEQLVDDIERGRRHFVQILDDKAVICGGSFCSKLSINFELLPSDNGQMNKAPSKPCRKRLHLIPSFSETMLREKIFKAGLESDLDVRLISLVMAPLHKEVFDPDAALKSNLENVYGAESHNGLYSEQEKYFDYTNSLYMITVNTLVVVGDNDWT